MSEEEYTAIEISDSINEARGRRCMTCQEPCKNHVGSYGKMCPLAKYPRNDEKQSTNLDNVTVLYTLVEQMSSLNVNREAMITSQIVLQNTVSDEGKTKISKDFVASTDFNLPIPVKEKEECIHNQ
jgi:hypothetical protein